MSSKAAVRKAATKFGFPSVEKTRTLEPCSDPVRFNILYGSSETYWRSAMAATSVALKISAWIWRRGRGRVQTNRMKPMHGRRFRISSPMDASSLLPAESEMAMIQIAPASKALDGSLSRRSLPEQAKDSVRRIQINPSHSFAVEKGCRAGGQNASGIKNNAPAVIHS